MHFKLLQNIVTSGAVFGVLVVVVVLLLEGAAVVVLELEGITLLLILICA